jgi:hypothetical protein
VKEDKSAKSQGRRAQNNIPHRFVSWGSHRCNANNHKPGDSKWLRGYTRLCFPALCWRLARGTFDADAAGMWGYHPGATKVPKNCGLPSLYRHRGSPSTRH